MSETVKRDWVGEAFQIASGETMLLAQNEHVRVVCAINVTLLEACHDAARLLTHILKQLEYAEDQREYDNVFSIKEHIVEAIQLAEGQA
jgi:hypothetical protein